jgi:succinate dehydrogenase hydrophobic anchor subunit
MMKTTKSLENASLWLAKVGTGGLVLFFLGVHFYMNHLFAPTGLLTYQDIVAYYRLPGVTIMEGLFLIFVIAHALLGLRSILLDLNFKEPVQKIIDWIMIATGSLASIYGVWLLIVIGSR